VGASEKTLTILEHLHEQGPSRVTDVATSIGAGKGTVHNHLATLREHGYVLKDGGTYRLGLKFLQIGGSVRNQSDLYHVARPKLQSLAEETGEIANLLTEERGRGIYLLHVRGADAVELDTHVGLQTHLHATALGKAMLAYMPQERVESILDHHGLPAKTPQTITDEGVLFDRLDTIRDRGYAIDRGERQAGLRCVAAPIRGDEDTVVGAISLSAPETRVADDDLDGSFAESVVSTANVIELEIRY
jgi:DNA-binding IclR family transcriptional regulator